MGSKYDPLLGQLRTTDSGGGGATDHLTAASDGTTIQAYGTPDIFGAGIVMQAGGGADSSVESTTGLYLQANAAVDGSGNFDPYIGLENTGTINISTSTQGVATSRQILLRADSGVAMGVDGAHWGYFKADNLTANQTYDLPNKSGTLALTSDISGGMWAPVSSGVFTMASNGAGLSISGLNGDTDKMYKLIVHAGNASFNVGFYISPNAFNGSAVNFANMSDAQQGATPSPGTTTGDSAFKPFAGSVTRYFQLEMTLYAASGAGPRIANSILQMINTSGAIDIRQTYGSHFWTDTTTNITSLSFADTVGHGCSGNYWLYKIA